MGWPRAAGKDLAVGSGVQVNSLSIVQARIENTTATNCFVPGFVVLLGIAAERIFDRLELRTYPTSGFSPGTSPGQPEVFK
jgi:hypothetical protein